MLVSFHDSIVETLSAVVAEIAVRHDLIREIAPEDYLVDVGMTSMAMVDLMLAIEARFDVTIPRLEMTPANFQSILTLSRLLGRLA